MNSDVRYRSSIGRVSPFGDLWINGCLPPPQSLSQAATSFIGSSCLAIHHTPLRVLTIRTLIRDQATRWVYCFWCTIFQLQVVPSELALMMDDAMHISFSDMFSSIVEVRSDHTRRSRSRLRDSQTRRRQTRVGLDPRSDTTCGVLP